MPIKYPDDERILLLDTELELAGAVFVLAAADNQPAKTTFEVLDGLWAGGGNGNGAMVGEVRMFGGSSAPSGWMLCDGTAISRTTYADLFAVIGTAFGVGDGSTTFNIPDFQGRSAVGVGSGDGLTTRAMGDEGGEEEHSLSVAEMPVHTHEIKTSTGTGAITAHRPTSNYGAYWTNELMGDTGGDGSHNTMHPFLGINFIIYHGVTS